MNKPKLVLLAFLFLTLPILALDRPKLQILNAGETDVEVFWIDADGKRVPNGKIQAGKDNIIGTSLGHQFVIEPPPTPGLRRKGSRGDEKGNS